MIRLAFVGHLLVSICSVAAMASLSGCSTISYYSQSVAGHTRLMLAREPLPNVILTAEPELKRQLELAVQLRRFAVTELGLPDSRSYQHYVALDRDFPVWNVVAAPEFSLTAKQWCYPVIGCAAYRGYFKESAAQHYAQHLKIRGYETMVGGATAYSTLGWFADPILSSMLRYGDVELAEMLFHELAHQQLYVNDDSNFNEAFATVVGEAGARRWLQQFRSEEISEYEDRLRAIQRFNTLITMSKQRLQRLYRQPLTTTQMRAAKHAEFETLQQTYKLVRDSEWGGRGWFDHWFSEPLNNARLAAFSTYREKVPALERLLATCQGDFARFYAALAAADSDAGIVIPDMCD